jgi:hypothetical protein
MKKRVSKIALVFALWMAAIAGMIGVALGQAPTVYQTGVLILSTLAGTEYLTVDNGGPRITTVPVNVVRNARSYAISAATSGTVSMTSSGANEILSGAVGTATVNLPASPADGFLAGVCNGTASAYSGTITVATTDSSTVVGSVSIVNLGASTCVQYQYTSGSAVWYKLM